MIIVGLDWARNKHDFFLVAVINRCYSTLHSNVNSMVRDSRVNRKNNMDQTGSGYVILGFV